MKKIEEEIKRVNKSVDDLIAEIKLYCAAVDRDTICYSTLIAFGQKGQRLENSLNNLNSLVEKLK
jgi:hypothetical protein